jgi:hypothetical protein
MFDKMMASHWYDEDQDEQDEQDEQEDQYEEEE